MNNKINKVTENNKGGLGWALVGGRSNTCFYCMKKVGEYHSKDCPKYIKIKEE